MGNACDSCVYYRGRHADDAAVRRAEEAGHPFPPGFCRRYPEPVTKSPEDWCGEHKPARPAKPRPGQGRR
jgi:hypothetical protein